VAVAWRQEAELRIPDLREIVQRPGFVFMREVLEI
jgi:hypothetical protein